MLDFTALGQYLDAGSFSVFPVMRRDFCNLYQGVDPVDSAWCAQSAGVQPAAVSEVGIYDSHGYALRSRCRGTGVCAEARQVVPRSASWAFVGFWATVLPLCFTLELFAVLEYFKVMAGNHWV